MLYRNILRTIHNPKIHHLCCTKTYPWGWMPKSHIDGLISNNPHAKLAKHESEEFKKGCAYAYQCVFSHFKYRTDFLTEEFTTPKMALVLNSLANQCEIKESINIVNTTIIKNHYESEIMHTNRKILGLWHQNEIEEEILLGILGPEAWQNKIPRKQVINVNFQLMSRVDVWTFERDITYEIRNWQVSNINGILLET